MNKQKIIALDCDGVLLNYHEAYGRAWREFNGTHPEIISPKSYFAETYYGINVEKHIKTKFLEFFNQTAWKNMIALPNAKEATHKLRKAGYKILVVTSIPPKAQELRHNNLINLGFAVDATIATGHNKDINPKKNYIEALEPEYFVDDLISNFYQIKNKTKFVLIDHSYEDSPNLTFPHQIKLHHKHTNLLDFVNKYI